MLSWGQRCTTSTDDNTITVITIVTGATIAPNLFIFTPSVIMHGIWISPPLFIIAIGVIHTEPKTKICSIYYQLGQDT